MAREIETGFAEIFPDADYRLLPVADGGEGTVEALVAATGGEHVALSVTGPLGTPVEAFYGLTGDGRTAVIEMAAAAGLALVPPERRDPLVTTTAGVGELIRAALDRGARHLVVGLGGSATNDGGAGMATALGARLLDHQGRPIGPGGGALADLARIDLSGLDPRLADCAIEAACDVDNPLVGPVAPPPCSARRRARRWPWSPRSIAAWRASPRRSRRRPGARSPICRVAARPAASGPGSMRSSGRASGPARRS